MLTFFVLVFLALPSAFAQFSNESQFSMVQTGGNSQVLTTDAKTTNVYKWAQKNQTKFGGHYTYGETNQGVSARNWDVNGQYERLETDHFSYVANEIIEGNRFQSIKTRYNSDLGGKYYYMKTDLKQFLTELDLRYTIEDRYAPAENQYAIKGRLYNEFSHKVNENMSYKLWLEYVPNFTDTRDYLINGEASITSILNSTFSLKVAYLGMYDNQVALPGLKNYDYKTTTSLVAKF